MKGFLLVSTLSVGLVACAGHAEPALEGPGVENLRASLTEIARSVRAGAGETCSIVMTASAEPPHSTRLTITNRGDEPWSVDGAWLPWREAGNGLGLFAISHGGEAVRVDSPIADSFDFREHTVTPGASLSGSLDLRQRVPALHTEKKKRLPIMVLWTYSPDPFRRTCHSAGLLEL